MSNQSMMIGQVASELSKLSEEDLPLVIEFVEYLQRQSAKPSRKKLLPAEIRAEVRRRAGLLSDVPREQIVTRFSVVADEIRRQAITNGTAIEGDGRGD